MPIEQAVLGGRIKKIDPNHFAASFYATVSAAKNSIYTVSLNDSMVIVTAANGLTVTLPAAGAATDRTFRVKNDYQSSNTTVNSNGGLIEGQTSITMANPSVSMDFYSNGSQWYVV